MMSQAPILFDYGSCWQKRSRPCHGVFLLIFAFATLYLFDASFFATKFPSPTTPSRELAIGPPVCDKVLGEVERYELGNLFYCRGVWAKMCGHITKGRKFIKQKKLEATVGGMYFIKANGKPNNVTLLESLLKTSGYERGSRNISLWHLRLGDNMNGGSFWNNSLVGPRGQLPRGKSYYEPILDTPTSTTQSNVVLMGNLCGGGYQKTQSQVNHGKQYVRDITAFLNDRRITVDTTRIGDGRLVKREAADMDLAFASTVGHYVCSGGTYSIMIGALVKHNGGTTYGCLDNGLG